MISKKEVLNRFKELVAIQSVSTDPARFSQIQKAVRFLKRQLVNLGFQVRIIGKENFPPLILAFFYLGKNHQGKNIKRKTIGIYGHYDVQPEDPIDQWKTNPFRLTLIQGKFYGRGVADNKGSIIQNLASIYQKINTKTLTNNIVFIFEGEEETGSPHLEEYIKRAKDLLSRVDVFYLTDVGMFDKNTPQIFYGLRGIISFELTVKIGDRDLHSGIYGNRVLNPVQVLANLLAKIKDADSGKILIPNFYRLCRRIAKDEINLLKKTLRSIKAEKKEAGVYRLLNHQGAHPTLAAKIYPSFDVNGIFSGYQGEGIKTIIPSSATVKFSFRLVEGQDPEEIENLVNHFIKTNIPQGVKYTLKTFTKAGPFYTKVRNPYVQKTAKVLEKVFGKKTLFNRAGGSIPAAEILQRLFNKPIILTGFSLPDSNLHAPNENFDEETFWQGIEALREIYG